MKKTKKILTILAGLALVVGMVGCGNTSQSGASAQPGSIAAIKKADTIKIGIFSDDAPFCYQDADGSYKGYDVEFGKRVAKELLGDENKITWVVVNPADRVAYVQTGKVDLMLADFTVTDDRAKSVDFTLPYEKVSIGVVSSEKNPITSADQLKGKTLAVNTGTTQDSYFSTNVPDANIVKVDAVSDGFQALTSGRADAFSQDNTTVLVWAKKNPGYVVGIKELGNKDYIAGAVKQGNNELLDYVNGLIKGKLKDEQFFHKDYEDTLKASFPDNITADQIVVEGGEKE
ncbi:ABC-type transporter, periplasmic subunit family 3 [Clostridium sp. DL-VIII]|uniref:transporter substrate-binding domain-containing protein n=1 Tax=Clostridium sp. DL-VIII TaxID=641107 RepID=UPI00023B07E9|nr:transporter substrate-binding domain-containing protein [Clostridium sp. DL-VIII]EHJ01657.1 ABC-type transporter, periplasmic subunit family 3 [Clostridium sp. DL-VIII]